MTNSAYSSVTGAQSESTLPTWLWRLGLGVLIGQFSLLLTTIGKQSGLPRRSSVPYFFVNGKMYALATPDEQWYQNVLANPLATLQSAYGTQSVRVRRVSDLQELSDAFTHLRQHRPTTAALYLAQAGVQNFPDDLAEAAPRLHLVTFEPTTAQTPLPLEADLSWLTVIAVLLVGWLLRRKPRRKTRKIAKA
ncbi:MAG: hypothetical protein CUN49_09235 [Candidatus Thermofonsia Clade 1 bacterium]|jgi:deazaflavin-dependent oxidoreductase (nitroreductase family)|uniref:DUF385 domain-containing protein n=1 Tax=Candidatus Thermofonsia Clade 1 bacterium TaxID=2364210 RepID=A0A2M8PDR7_9CHLR|nr:MAG: hypothetical protein CUN49_09235 [Candidatus Thermofonsia Clade 1 bacterium]RMF53268.1 MAG: DUF385 domain-containing protein [Chloroflexota bacterium]